MAALPRSEASPLLENGDQLRQPEFHRRYELHPELEHVQLIEGIVYSPSPIRIQQHGEPQGLILAWLGAYAANNPGVRFSGPTTLILDGDNEPEPDGLLYRDGGQATVEGNYLRGAPELIVEIAASSASIDLGPKLRAYRRNGVQEYLVWATEEDRLLWFHLVDGNYAELLPDATGIIHSEEFPGLRLDVSALLRRDAASVLGGQSKG